MDTKLALVDLIKVKDGKLDLSAISTIVDETALPSPITIECDPQGFVSRIVFEDDTVVEKVYVYLIQAANGAVKIGKSQDVNKRLSELNVASPLDLELIGSVCYIFGHQLEKELHAQYADKWIKGEWFDLDEDDIEVIKHMFADINKR